MTTDTSDDEPEATRGALLTFRDVWRHRRWRWLLASTLVSLAGDFLSWIALVVFLTDQTDPALWLALSFVARLLPWVLIGPIGGAIVDRFPRRRLLVGLDVARAALFGAVALVVALDGHAAVVLVVLALVSTCSAIHRPARVAAIPQVVPESDLAGANAAEEGLSQVAWFIGPAIGAALVAVLDPAAVLVLDAATFVVSALLVARAGDLGGTRPATVAERERASVLDDVRNGLALLVRDRGLRGLVVVSTAAALAFGAEQVLYVLVAADRLDLGAEGVGYLLAAMGVGGVLAAPVSARVGDSPRLGWWFALAGILAALPLIAVSLTNSLPVVLAITAIEGGAAVVFEVIALTLTQRAVAERSIGLVSSVVDAVATIGQTMGALVAPLLVSATSLAVALQVSGAVTAALTLACVPALLALATATDERRRRDRATTRLLGRTRELAPLEPVDLERLARAAVERTVVAGTTVIRAGDVADDVYVVRSGTAHVTVDGLDAGAVPDLGPDDLFGEIGLVRGIPRTATVTASTELQLVVIDGATFLATVVPSGGGPLVGGMFHRLANTHATA